MRIVMFAAAIAAISLGAAEAQTAEGASLTLAAPRASTLIHDGAQWRCETTTCRATKVKSVPALRACRRLAAELGAVTAFTWRGKALDAQELAACNAAARN